MLRYVDQYRMMSVQLGGTDLKGMIGTRGLLGFDSEFVPGEPNELMYLKQAKHYIKKCQYEQALKYIERSLQYNPQSEVLRLNAGLPFGLLKDQISQIWPFFTCARKENV